MEHDYPATNKTIGSTLVPMAREIEGDSRTPLLVLLAVVGSSAADRHGECRESVAGAGGGTEEGDRDPDRVGRRARAIVRQLLTESLVLAGAGGIVGVLLAMVATPSLRVLAEGRIARASEIAVDGRVLLFALGVALAAGILFGLVPALAATRADQNADLRSGGRGSAGICIEVCGRRLVAGQVALAMLVLVGAALLTRSLMRLTGVDPGFRVEHLLTARVALPGSYKTHAQIVGFLPAIDGSPGG